MTTDYETLIIGGGVTGIALARTLALRGSRPGSVAVVEKESTVARHTSGNNSGVIHGGYNQRPGTLKARLAVEGNARLKAFCRSAGVPMVEGGILIVAKTDAERSSLEELERRGRDNGVQGLRLLERHEIATIEPYAVGAGALHAPSGASVDAPAYVRALASEAAARGVELKLRRKVLTVERQAGRFAVNTGDATLTCTRLVNCAGLHADRIAHALGAGLDVGIVPVRGEYRVMRPERQDLIRSHVYPIPDLKFPFLGVHWTKSTNGEVLVGPNAVPALGREAYSWRDSSLVGAFELATDPRAWRLLAQPGFARLIAQQVAGSLSRRRFAAEAQALVPSARAEDLRPGPAGIRAQLVDRTGKMVEDILIEEHEGAMHVLNVVSPGLTCSLAFAEYLADRLNGLR